MKAAAAAATELVIDESEDFNNEERQQKMANQINVNGDSDPENVPRQQDIVINIRPDGDYRQILDELRLPHLTGSIINETVFGYGDICSTILSMALFVTDIGTDTTASILYLLNREYWRSGLTSAFIALPWLVALLQVCFGPGSVAYGGGFRTAARWWNRIFVLKHDIGKLRNGWAFRRDRTMSRFNVTRYRAWMEAQKAANEARVIECLFESAPQFILQSAVFFLHYRLLVIYTTGHHDRPESYTAELSRELQRHFKTGKNMDRFYLMSFYLPMITLLSSYNAIVNTSVTNVKISRLLSTGERLTFKRILLQYIFYCLYVNLRIILLLIYAAEFLELVTFAILVHWIAAMCFIWNDVDYTFTQRLVDRSIQAYSHLLGITFVDDDDDHRLKRRIIDSVCNAEIGALLVLGAHRFMPFNVNVEFTIDFLFTDALLFYQPCVGHGWNVLRHLLMAIGLGIVGFNLWRLVKYILQVLRKYCR